MPAERASRPRWRAATRVALRGPLDRRTWRATGYAVAGLPLAVVGALVVIGPTAIGLVLAITLLGLPILAGGGRLAIALAGADRDLASRILGVDIPAATPRRGQGVVGRITTAVVDPVAWRARLYLVLKLPLAGLTVYATVIGWVEAFVGVLYPLFWQLSGPDRSPRYRPGPVFDVGGMVLHTGSRPVPGLHHRFTAVLGQFAFDTWPRALLIVVGGLVLALIVPWVTRGLVRLDVLLQRLLLGPTAAERRVEELEEARAIVAEDAAAALRRIERDLHDGTQARLVALAMQLGRARERLSARDDGDGALELVATAHDDAKLALEELRSTVRGIHPPALDVGLVHALTTLTARSAVPTRLVADVTEEPSEAIATIAYFSAAELLTNVARHSGADHARLDATQEGRRLRLVVTDAGRGGAAPEGGSGLRGLGERVRAVGGHLAVDSPSGGPTAVTVDLPLRV